MPHSATSIARKNMVISQIAPNHVPDPSIHEAMMSVPRETFVPATLSGVSYADEDIPLGENRFLMEPMIFARLMSVMAIQPGMRVLDIAPASGYSSAVMAKLGASVQAVEENDHFTALFRKNASAQAIGLHHGALADGAADGGPYDRVFINGMVDELPESLLRQLKPEGFMVTVQRLRGVGKACVAFMHDNMPIVRHLFDANVNWLPSFVKTQSFTF